MMMDLNMAKDVFVIFDNVRYKWFDVAIHYITQT